MADFDALLCSPMAASSGMRPTGAGQMEACLLSGAAHSGDSGQKACARAARAAI